MITFHIYKIDLSNQDYYTPCDQYIITKNYIERCKYKKI